MEYFKQFGGNIIEDLGEYCRNYIRKYPDIVIFVGCDSKQMRKRSLFATAICFYHPNNGAHIIFRRDRITKIRDMFSRLWQEAEFSREVSEYLEVELKG